MTMMILGFLNKRAPWALGVCLMAGAGSVRGERKFPPGRNPPGCTVVDTDPEEYRGKPTGTLTEPMKEEILERKRANGAPPLPDLDVTYIERTPRFPRYDVEYDPPFKNPRLSTKEKNLQRWPFEGYFVTFHVHVANKGLRPSPETDWVVSIDGDVLPYGRGNLPGLEPLEETVVSVKWPWSGGRHEVSEEVDTRRKIREISERNNKISDWTDAYTFFWTVQDRAHIAHECVKNSYGSYSAESWARSVLQWLNWSFDQCKYPTTPDGIPARVRLDYYEVEEEPWQTHRRHPAHRYFDATWMHSPGGGSKPHEAQDHYLKRIENVCIEYAECNAAYHPLKAECNANLAKQLAGELGLIDYHRFNIQPNQCLVKTDNGKLLRDVFPNKATHRIEVKGLLQYRQPARLIWSEISANALTNDYCRRRGFSGVFLLDLPNQSFVRFLDRRGSPLAKALVSVYQRDGNTVPDEVKRTGVTDGEGLFDLGEKPFGAVDVRGLNGTLLFRVARIEEGDADWVWLSILDLYMAKQRGQRDRAVIPLKTTL